MPPFEIVRPTVAAIPVLAHVPHASTTIPAQERAAILLDDAALAREVVRMTDWHTDRLFGWAVDRGASALINRRSRLVIDPERFADQSLEPMEARGQGAVYTRTSDGEPLRTPDPDDRERIITTLYEPYHRALSTLVAEQLRPVRPVLHPRLPLLRDPTAGERGRSVSGPARYLHRHGPGAHA